MTDFVHLHLHTEFSLLDGACRIKDLMQAVKQRGQKSVAITDHGVMYGVIDFYKAAKKAGVHPIIGCEVYVATRTMNDRVQALDSEHNHLVLLCENNIGYQNLMKLVSESFIHGFYGKPRVDKELLAKHSEGLIALSSCLGGAIPRALRKGNIEKAREEALWYKKTFGKNNYFIELQDHEMREQQQILQPLVNLAKELDIPLVATNDVHYINKEDSKVQEVLICIQTNNVVGDETGFDFESEEFYLKTGNEMAELFKYAPEAIENTGKIAERCNVEIEFGETHLPHLEIKGVDDHYTYLKDMCEKGFLEKYGENAPQAYKERLEYELSVIRDMGYVDYFLIVCDFVAFAKRSGIPVGPGRGSGAGSLASYCIGITGVDPMHYQLFFERFLNPERVTMPDFDIDFCYERRSEVIDYVVHKYGKNHVAQIVTFGTMAARAAVRDVGRALGMSYSSVDSVAKLFPQYIGITIERALKQAKELKARYDSEPPVRELLDMALKVEGMPRHASTHAAGVVVTREPVNNYVPLAVNDESVVTQYPMNTLEELGLLKIDFLGLRTLTVIDDAQKLVQKHTPDFDIETIDINDKKVYGMFSKGLTEGIFQFESAGMKSTLIELKAERLEDLIAITSLYRPGPADSIPLYGKNKRNPENIQYSTPLLKDILDVTYGCIVYQEQVMEIFRKLAGYSYGLADIVRRSMSKKDKSVMQKERKNFIYGVKNADGTVECDGAIARGVTEKASMDIFDDMSTFASYAFNKSHAAAYALVAYRTGFLKYYYPKEFMSALLTSVLQNEGKVSAYINECQRMGIEILPPHVNNSYEQFTVEENGIRFGLLAIKNLGRGMIHSITSERDTHGKYTTFFSFCSRVHEKEFNKRALESIIKAGALDGLDATRKQMLEILPTVVGDLDATKRSAIDGQIGFFGTDSTFGESTGPVMPDVGEFSDIECYQMEKEITGLYLSGHPMAEHEKLSAKLKSAETNELLDAGTEFSSLKDESSVNLLGMVVKVVKKRTRAGEDMAFVIVEDQSGSIETIVFPKLYAQYMRALFDGNVIFIEGRLSLREDETPKLICMKIYSFDEAQRMGALTSSPSTNEAKVEKKEEIKKPVRLFVRLPSKESDEYKKVFRVLSLFTGRTRTYLYYLDVDKYEPLSFSVDVNEPLLEELKYILKIDDNIVLQ